MPRWGPDRCSLVCAAACLLVGSLLLGAPAAGGELAQPSGPVVLTVAGAVGASNRGAFEPFEDAFLDFHERRFEQAAVFDLAMLERFEQVEVEIAYSEWPAPLRLRGPRLSDVLLAVGAARRPITVLALDGYGLDLTAEEVERLPWILALRRDGGYLDLGGRGPLWLVYRRPDGEAPTADDEGRWVWAAFYIEVR